MIKKKQSNPIRWLLVKDRSKCLNEIKMGVLAKALIYPGSNIFIMNLITTSTDADEEEEEEGAENENGAENSKQWIK